VWRRKYGKRSGLYGIFWGMGTGLEYTRKSRGVLMKSLIFEVKEF
jgi:hypothetical protein